MAVDDAVRAARSSVGGAADVGEQVAGRSGGSGRRLVERITPGLLVGVVAGLLAFVLVAGVLADRRAMVSVAVPTRVIAAGEPVTVDAVEFVEVPESGGLAAGLVTEADVVAGDVVAGRVLVVGEPVTRSAVSAVSGRPASRVIAVPLDGWGAAGGELVVGDQIDVVDTRGDVAVFVVQAATVVDRSSSSSDGRGLGGASDGVWVAIEVTADEALGLASVVAADGFVVVRSTGVPEGS